MLLFSTILSINKRMTKDDFIRLVIEWNQRSPHRTNVIPNINWKGERNIRFGDEYLWLDIEEYRNKNIIAVRYEKCEADGVIWDTDYIMNFNEMKMAIRLDRSYTTDALIDDSKFSTPHFITLLIEHGYLEDDDDLPVTRTPILINENNMHLLADIIDSGKRYRLPVVYISRTFHDDDPVDINKLAGRLKGVAHVLAQESKATNRKIKEICNSSNEYYGAIGVYYPNQTLGHRRYMYRSAVGYDDYLLEKIVRLVVQYCSSQSMDTLYTWQGVNNALLRDRLQSQREERLAEEQARKKAEEEKTEILLSMDEKAQSLRKQAMEEARDEANTIIESFDDDMQKLQKQLENLTKENEALRYENQGLRAKLSIGESVPILVMGDEYEFYQGEIKDLVLSMISDYMTKSTAPKTRRRDVAKDVVDSNNYQRISENKMEQLKKLLNDYKGMTSRIRQELESMGFNITDDGKHYKLTYFGDGRYCYTISKTPSDGRSGKNDVHGINKLVF